MLNVSLLDRQRLVLERIADGAPLEKVLLTLVELVEEQAGDMRCAILLADAAQTELRFVAAPNVPEDYRRDIEPYLRIAPDMGSCGTAAYLRQPVYTHDTATDPRWKNFGSIAARNGLRAIWSTPILSDENRVLGTFAMYYGAARLPTDEHIRLIDMAVQMARVAIEANEGDHFVRLVFDNGPRPVVITDAGYTIVRANRAFARALGYAAVELRGRPLAEITLRQPNETLPEAGTEVAGERRYRTRDGRVLWMRERAALRRDEQGDARYIVLVVDELSEAGDDPLARLSRREREVLDAVLAGKSSKEIAAELGISAASVDTYRGRIMVKIGVRDLPALVRFAVRRGIVGV